VIPYQHPWHKPGMIAFCTSGYPRTEDFWVSLNGSFVPNGSELHKLSGVGIATMMNMAANKFMSKPELQWMWITGDDHVWDHDLIPKMLDRAKQHGCDILAPMVCHKTPPFDSVMFMQDQPLDFQDLPITKNPVPVFRVGTAGMLVQRRVFEAMAEDKDTPPFMGQGHSPDQVGEDIHFCDLAQKHGFRVWVDPTLYMGHSPYGFSCWPWRDDKGVWWIQLRFPENRVVMIQLERPDRTIAGG
jgi:hypothetical protein